MKIEINDLCMTYKTGKKALIDITLVLESPCLVGLVGPNGAGKSTLMKLLSTRLLQTSGSIIVDGMKLSENEKYLKSRLGYLPQDFGLYDELTVRQFLDYMAILKDIGKNSKTIIDDVIADTHLGEKKNSKIGTLSGGQRQRVGVAQALMNNPELLILDEPTVGLDPEERVYYRNLFSKNATDKICILSTHIVEDVQSVCNRIIVINKGVILFDGSPLELIRTAQGHVGVYEIDTQNDILIGRGYRITSRVFTSRGIQYRFVGEVLPTFATPVEPSLEDAYIFLMSNEEENDELY